MMPKNIHEVEVVETTSQTYRVVGAKSGADAAANVAVYLATGSPVGDVEIQEDPAVVLKREQKTPKRIVDENQSTLPV